RSSTRTRRPCLQSTVARVDPARPPPTTITSKSMFALLFTRERLRNISVADNRNRIQDSGASRDTYRRGLKEALEGPVRFRIWKRMMRETGYVRSSLHAGFTGAAV